MNEVFAWLKSQDVPEAQGIAGTTTIKWYVFSTSRCFLDSVRDGTGDEVIDVPG